MEKELPTLEEIPLEIIGEPLTNMHQSRLKLKETSAETTSRRITLELQYQILLAEDNNIQSKWINQDKATQTTS